MRSLSATALGGKVEGRHDFHGKRARHFRHRARRHDRARFPKVSPATHDEVVLEALDELERG